MTFGQFRNISPTAVKFPDISRFFWVVVASYTMNCITKYGYSNATQFTHFLSMPKLARKWTLSPRLKCLILLGGQAFLGAEAWLAARKWTANGHRYGITLNYCLCPLLGVATDNGSFALNPDVTASPTSFWQSRDKRLQRRQRTHLQPISSLLTHDNTHQRNVSTAACHHINHRQVI